MKIHIVTMKSSFVQSKLKVKILQLMTFIFFFLFIHGADLITIWILIPLVIEVNDKIFSSERTVCVLCYCTDCKVCWGGERERERKKREIEREERRERGERKEGRREGDREREREERKVWRKERTSTHTHTQNVYEFSALLFRAKYLWNLSESSTFISEYKYE